MAKWEEYRRFAAECLELAQKAQALEETLRLLEMAQRWVLLAERAASCRDAEVTRLERRKVELTWILAQEDDQIPAWKSHNIRKNAFSGPARPEW